VIDVILGISAVVLAAFVLWRMLFREIAARWVRHSRRPQWAAAAAAAQTLCLSLAVALLLVGRGSRLFGPIVVLGLITVVVSIVLVAGAGIRRIPKDSDTEEEPHR
jgi:hypothetical protein